MGWPKADWEPACSRSWFESNMDTAVLRPVPEEVQAHSFWDHSGTLSVALPPELVTVLGAMAITLPPIPLSGHPEDLIALGAMLYGIAAAFDGRPKATGWWLGVALAFQPFAFLAISIAFVFLTRRQWLTTLGPIVAVPLAFLLVPAVTDPGVTVPQLLHQKVYDVFGHISPTWNLDPGVAAYIRLAVALAAIPAALLLARYLPTSRRQGRRSWYGRWRCSSLSGSASPNCFPTSWPRPLPSSPSVRRVCRGGDWPPSALSLSGSPGGCTLPFRPSGHSG